MNGMLLYQHATGAPWAEFLCATATAARCACDVTTTGRVACWRG